MHVGRGAGALMRRWYVFLPLLALTAALAVRVGDGIHPQHESTATAILTSGTGAHSNRPYGDVLETNRVLSIVLTSPESRAAIERMGLEPRYSVIVRDNSSLLHVEVAAGSREQSVATSEAVLAMAREELARRQRAAGVPADARMGVQTIQAPAAEGAVHGSSRNMVMVGVAGLVVVWVITRLVDDLLLGACRRRGRRRPLTNGVARVGPGPAA